MKDHPKEIVTGTPSAVPRTRSSPREISANIALYMKYNLRILVMYLARKVGSWQCAMNLINLLGITYGDWFLNLMITQLQERNRSLRIN